MDCPLGKWAVDHQTRPSRPGNPTFPLHFLSWIFMISADTWIPKKSATLELRLYSLVRFYKSRCWLAKNHLAPIKGWIILSYPIRAPRFDPNISAAAVLSYSLCILEIMVPSGPVILRFLFHLIPLFLSLNIAILNGITTIQKTFLANFRRIRVIQLKIVQMLGHLGMIYPWIPYKKIQWRQDRGDHNILSHPEYVP